MANMIEAIARFGEFHGERRGVTAIEYGLMAGAIAIALVLAMAVLNSGVSSAFSTAAAAFPR